jgi:CheY-like chemotaxis protein
LRIDCDPAPALVHLDPHDLEQVILNLVINARDALPVGGAIDIAVVRQTTGEGSFVGLRIHDNGIGMAPDVQAHLFEPFFTTKEVGAGTGLGLAFVDGIVRNAKGFVTVESAPGQGTTFLVYFPVAEAGAADAAADAPAPEAARAWSGATILLVEDERAVRDMTTLVLGRAGYRVLAAATPSEASTLFDEHGASIDLLLTDIVMPEMHGPVLAQRLIARRPGLRVLFVSGHSDAMPTGTTATGKTAFLGKPFAPANLLATVTEVLNAA